MTQTSKSDLSDRKHAVAPLDDASPKSSATKPTLEDKPAPVDPASDPPPEADFA